MLNSDVFILYLISLKVFFFLTNIFYAKTHKNLLLGSCLSRIQHFIALRKWRGNISLPFVLCLFSTQIYVCMITYCMWCTGSVYLKWHHRTWAYWRSDEMCSWGKDIKHCFWEAQNKYKQTLRLVCVDRWLLCIVSHCTTT